MNGLEKKKVKVYIGPFSLLIKGVIVLPNKLITSQNNYKV